jgi:hypothetical protein
MAAVNTNLTIEQGSDYEIDLTITNDDGTPLNLTGYTADSKIRKHYGSSTTESFSITFVDRLAGEINLSMGSTTTSSLVEGRYVYDIVLTSPQNFKTRVIQGNVLVNPGVTL